MQDETYEAIKTEWAKITSGEQRALIYRYVQGDGPGPRGSWMEFLQNQFGLHHPQSFRKAKTSSRHRRL